jgi:hypothetical protein
MGQYDDRVERQRLLLEAEDWSKTIKSIHVHGCTSMWYETEDSIKDIEDNGQVTDRAFNSGLIYRYRQDELIHTFGEALTGDALIDSYCRHT